MKSLLITLTLGFSLSFFAHAKLPEVESMKQDETITVVRITSEPAILEFKFIFQQGSVSISENKKNLGTLKITNDDAKLIDQFLNSVRRARKSNRSHFGTPFYSITHLKAGIKTGEWTYNIIEPKKLSKPVLSLRELVTRLENQKQLDNKPK